MIDPLEDPFHNSFSSAAIPFSAFSDYSIPPNCVSKEWNSWQLIDNKSTRFRWRNDHPLGMILDFGLLRKEMWAKAKSSGVEILNGWKVCSVRSFDRYAIAELLDPLKKRIYRQFTWIVDATGHSRSLLRLNEKKLSDNNDFLLKGSGLEFHIHNSYNLEDWANSLSFLIGTNWIPNGYGWVFPMNNNILKVGICRLDPPFYVKKRKPLNYYLKNLIKALNFDQCPVIDRHGGIIGSTLKRSEPHFDGRVIGVGDSVSTANLLGGEGIRFALLSAEMLSRYLIKACLLDSPTIKMETKLLRNYQNALKQELGWRWVLSSRIARKTWLGLNNDNADDRITRLLSTLHKKVSAEDISALLFDYRFERYGFRIVPYLLGWR